MRLTHPHLLRNLGLFFPLRKNFRRLTCLPMPLRGWKTWRAWKNCRNSGYAELCPVTKATPLPLRKTHDGRTSDAHSCSPPFWFQCNTNKIETWKDVDHVAKCCPKLTCVYLEANPIAQVGMETGALKLRRCSTDTDDHSFNSFDFMSCSPLGHHVQEEAHVSHPNAAADRCHPLPPGLA